MGKHKLKLPETTLLLSSHSSHVDPAFSSEIQMHFEIPMLITATAQKKFRELPKAIVMNPKPELTLQNTDSHQISASHVFAAGTGV